MTKKFTFYYKDKTIKTNNHKIVDYDLVLDGNSAK